MPAIRILAVLILLLPCLLGSCGDDGGDGSFKIGVILPMTGPISPPTARSPGMVMKLAHRGPSGQAGLRSTGTLIRQGREVR